MSTACETTVPNEGKMPPMRAPHTRRRVREGFSSRARGRDWDAVGSQPQTSWPFTGALAPGHAPQSTSDEKRHERFGIFHARARARVANAEEVRVLASRSTSVRASTRSFLGALRAVPVLLRRRLSARLPLEQALGAQRVFAPARSARRAKRHAARRLAL